MTLPCPRRRESAISYGDPSKDSFLHGHCSYCGSLDPELLMVRIEAEEVELVPTDKSYKVYVNVLAGSKFTREFRDCPRESRCSSPEQCTHWKTEEITDSKFYFQHFSPKQRERFIELHNQKKLKLGEPGYFYTTPFFARIDTVKEPTT